MHISRRHFVKAAGAVTLGFAGLHRLFESNALAALGDEAIPFGYGPLRPDPKGLLDLPDGFSYTVISRIGTEMDDGLLVPGQPDGMAAFPGPNGRTILIRNHELHPEDFRKGPFGLKNERVSKVPEADLADPGRDGLRCQGGCSTLVVNMETLEVEREFMSLVGTVYNCAGGPTPWGSWITCEETTRTASDEGLTLDHGYPYEVPASAEMRRVKPVPYKAMGRFRREAIAVDPRSGVVYQTEDVDDGLFYRYIPNVPGELGKGGKLQALVVRDQKSLDTRNWPDNIHPPIPRGKRLAVAWIDMDEIEAPKNDLRLRGFAAGAAQFARAEGIWYGNDAAYFACTNGGRAKRGQVWRYTPSRVEGTPAEADQPGELELLIEPNDPGMIDNADNITVAPWGDLILCEDGSGEDYLVGVTPKGRIYKFARNATSHSEFAGSTFSPDGSTLFVNMQANGLTFAIRGPWRTVAHSAS